MTDDIPTFYTTIKNGQRSFECPKCGKKNLHGSGDGHRISHCPCWPRGYEIKDQDD
jgi:predicted RNA-binding Zn-ribbon protein involved in translation (DUF1610 family)